MSEKENKKFQMNIDWNEITRRIKYLRTSNRLSQHAFAEKLGMSRSAYGQFETGTIKLSIESIVKVAKHFDVSLDYLVYGTRAESRNEPSNNPEVNYKVEILLVKNLFKTLHRDLVTLENRIDKIESIIT